MGRNDILEVYYRDNYDKLVKVARKRVGDYSLPNAEDAVQEAFVRALRYFRSYNKDDNLDFWFRGILTNCINHQKGLERNQGVVYREEIESTDDILSSYLINEKMDGLFKKISSRDRDILNNYFFYGMKSREIHEMLGVSHDVVRDVIRRFRLKVKG